MAEENFIFRDGKFYNEAGQEVFINEEFEMEVNNNNNSDNAEKSNFEPGFIRLGGDNNNQSSNESGKMESSNRIL